MFSVLDTETSGLSRRDVVIQCALAVYEADGTLCERYNEYWQLPEGLRIDPRAAAVHGITAATLDAQGRPGGGEVRTLQSRLHDLRTRGVPIVAHNAAFDVRMLRQTAEAHGADWDLAAEDVFCVMRAAKPILQLPACNGRPKAPTNVECYSFLHGGPPDPALGPLHDAMTCAHTRPHAAHSLPAAHAALCACAQGRDDHRDGLPRGAHPRVVAVGLGRPRTKKKTLGSVKAATDALRGGQRVLWTVSARRRDKRRSVAAQAPDCPFARIPDAELQGVWVMRSAVLHHLARA